MVVTAARVFGESIQTVLEATGLYKVMVVDSDQEALLCIQTVAFTIAILDAELPGGRMIALASTMRKKLPKMHLVFICSENNPIYSEVLDFKPAGLLGQPFDAQVLLDALTKVLQAQTQPAGKFEPKRATPPPSASLSTDQPTSEWLHDAQWAATKLTQLSLESSAQAALIVRDGSLWAYAGELSQFAAHEVVDSLMSSWTANSTNATRNPGTHELQNDIVRFIHLDATQGEFMLYATSLGKGMVLSLVFETKTPFSTIRAQAGYLARVLASPPGTPLPSYPKAAVTISLPSSEHATNNTSTLSANLPPLLEDVPPPTPRRAHKTPSKNDQTPTWYDEASLPASISEQPDQPLFRANTDREGGISRQPSMSEDDRTLPTYSSKPASEKKSTPANNQISPLHTLSQSTGINIPLTDNQKTIGNSITTSDLLPTSPTLHYLTYSCALLPRLPNQKLVGDLAKLLEEWIPQLYQAFSWQILQISASQEYLMVIARVAPNTAPGTMVRILRQQSSRRIFAVFPSLAADNPSNDFWAPGYLILSNSQPPPADILRYFIEQTRSQQGFANNSPD